MTGIVNYEAFLLAGILLNLTPGNDTIFILSKSIAHGRKAGIISALGIAAGSVVHTVLAAFGLSLIIAKSILLFNLIKYLGAAYLVYIGYKMLTDKSRLQTENVAADAKTAHLKLFRDGMLTNILNPKVALFYIAFLPQFIDSHQANTILPFLLLGATFITTGAIWCFVLAIFAAAIFGKLKNNPFLAKYINKFCGLAMIGLGLKVALTDGK